MVNATLEISMENYVSFTDYAKNQKDIEDFVAEVRGEIADEVCKNDGTFL